MDKHSIKVNTKHRLILAYDKGGLDAVEKEVNKLKKEERIRELKAYADKMSEEVSRWTAREKQLNFVQVDKK